MKNALKFTEESLQISQTDKEIIFHLCKSLLFNKNKSWVKKVDQLFNVTMGASDGAEICELVGCFILSSIPAQYNNKDIGLYRDDGLAVLKNKSGPQCKRIKEDFQKLFKIYDLDITIQCNVKAVDYLDVTLDLNNGNYKPYHKPNNEINAWTWNPITRQLFSNKFVNNKFVRNGILFENILCDLLKLKLGYVLHTLGSLLVLACLWTLWRRQFLTENWAQKSLFVFFIYWLLLQNCDVFQKK